jgi:uncharacterized protein (TIGR02466 family)
MILNVGPWEINPCFSMPVSSKNIDPSISFLLKTMCKRVEWIEDNTYTGVNGFYSKDRNVLDCDQEIKNGFVSICKDYIVNALCYDTEIQITTSWFTKTIKGGHCVDHTHCNSWFSAVVYFGEYDENSSPLVFSTNPPQIMVGSKNSNFLNSYNLTIEPIKNKIIIFPSNLRHKVMPHKSDIPRYSLSFNIMPLGLVGEGDSSYQYK